MIVNFKDDETEKIFNDIISRKFPPEIQRVARRKLLTLDAVERLQDLRLPPSNHLEALKGIEKGSTAYGLTISGGSASYGVTTTPMTWKSPTIIDLAQDSVESQRV